MALSALVVCILLSDAVFSLRAPRETNQLLVGYWGQNGGRPGRQAVEEPLKEVCQTTKYDVLVISFLYGFFDEGNKDDMPSTDFTTHCTTAVSKDYPSLLRCPKIEAGIQECHRRGKRVLLSLGGYKGDGTIDSPSRARLFAERLFKLFLGGTGLEDLRPFGNATLDGIDLDIEGGRYNNYPEFITALRNLTDVDQNNTYLITGSPNCPYPDHFLGPVYKGTGLQETGHHFDHLYVQFYNNYCHTGNSQFFLESLKKWLAFAFVTKPGPSIFIGIPAARFATSSPQYYRPPSQLKAIYEKIRDLPDLGGLMLWDVSWDQSNVVDGKRYSEHAFALLKRHSPTTTAKPTTTEANTTAATTAEVNSTTGAPTTMTSPTNTTIAPTTPGDVTCSGTEDGIYSDPTDCSRFFICVSERMYNFSCTAGLAFNDKTQSCDWPKNVPKCA